MTDKTIIFDISGHGLGHLSISGPVINEFIKLFPNVRVIVRSSLAVELIQSFVQGQIEYYGFGREVTLVAPNALDIDVEGSVSAYEVLYERWYDELRLHTAFLRDVRPSLVVSNVGYLSLAAAQQVGIPAIGLCCMNWLDMFRSFCRVAPNFQNIERLLFESYAGTRLFLQPKPHMSMADIDVRRSIGPIARVGCNKADALRATVGCAADEVVVLHSLGGWPGQSYAKLPRIEGVKWLVSGAWTGDRPDIASCRELNWPFADIVASVDVAVGKDSYGTVVEAACAGVRLVMSPRGGWPEEKYLSNWAQANCCFVMSDQQMDGGEVGLQRAIERILLHDRRPPVPPSGILEAVNAIACIGML